MKKEIWEIWIDNKQKREKDFLNYLRLNKIKKEIEIKELIEGHLEKADHNLKAADYNLKGDFNDWAVVSSYYAIYHASLALCALKGYSTKDYNATLLILIKEFYLNELNKEEFSIIKKAFIEKEHILYYTEAKSKRQKASYSTQKLFDEKEVEELRKKAVNFVNKVKEIKFQIN